VLTLPQYHAELARLWLDATSPPYRTFQVRFEIPHRDGHGIPVELRSVAMVVDGEYVGSHGAARDIRAQERLEQDLRRQAAELAAADERAHLARELHDSVTQALFSMTLTTRTIEMLIERDPAAAIERLGELRQLERDALAEMRALIFELRPGNLENDGLVQSLRTLAAGVESRTGLPITVEADPIDRLAASHENALYRIAQEALHNVVKHASARKVRVTLAALEDEVRLLVEDDGAGFDPARLGEGQLGLVGMRTRAEQVGGWMNVSSAPGSTRIEVGVKRVDRQPGGAVDDGAPETVTLTSSVPSVPGARASAG
jgi:signal transduction histidine kinase